MNRGNIKLICPNGNHRWLYVNVFPGGEVQVRLPEVYLHDECDVTIEATITNSEDLMAVLMAKDAIDREVCKPNVILHLTYLPYARQDRVCAPRESLSVAVVAKMINAMDFYCVIINDPHSDVGPALIDRSIIRTQASLLESSWKHMRKYHDAYLVAPDAGAAKKIYDLALKFNNREIFIANKKRDMATGDVIKTECHGDVEGKNLLIVDDICDGGRTFIELAKVLREKGANNIGLYVTNGIFSKGKDVLLEHIDDLYCHTDWTEL